MAQADGDLFSWYKAHANGLDVTIFDPGVWVSQVQGPRSLDVLAAALDGPVPEPFRYFDCAEVSIAGQPCVISRSGFTNELGWELDQGAGTKHERQRQRSKEGWKLHNAPAMWRDGPSNARSDSAGDQPPYYTWVP